MKEMNEGNNFFLKIPFAISLFTVSDLKKNFRFSAKILALSNKNKTYESNNAAS